MRAQEPLPSGKPGDGGTFLPRSAARPTPSHFPTATPALPHRPSQPPLGWAGGFGQGARAPSPGPSPERTVTPRFQPYPALSGLWGALPVPGRRGRQSRPQPGQSRHCACSQEAPPPGWAPPSGHAHNPHHRRPSLPRQGPPAARRFWGKCKDSGTPWRHFQAWATA